MGSPWVPLIIAVAAWMMVGAAEGAQWCIARSTASEKALQAALDYACGTGAADCAPIQAEGLCFLPNTLQAHASYAFNSFFQRSRAAPGACDFAGAATVTISDPSYGSCTFPSSASTAGNPTITNSSTPTTTTPAAPGSGSTTGGGVGGLTPDGGLTPGSGLTPTGGLTPGFGPTVPNTDISSASAILCSAVLFSCGYVLPLLF